MDWRAVHILLRLASVVIVAALLTIHVKSVRVFRWEQSVSGGVLVAYGVAMLGLVLNAGLESGFKTSRFFQAYICGTGTVLLTFNAVAIYRRWRGAGELTRVVAELLGVLGVPLRRQVKVKVYLSAVAACILFCDLFLVVISVTDIRKS